MVARVKVEDVPAPEEREIPRTRGPQPQGRRTTEVDVTAARGRTEEARSAAAREAFEGAKGTGGPFTAALAAIEAIGEFQTTKGAVGATVSSGRTRGAVRGGGTAGGRAPGTGTPTFAVDGNFRSGVVGPGLFSDTTGLSAIDKLNPRR